jgi:hypothetical protein
VHLLVVLGFLRADLLLGELARELPSAFCSSVRANDTPVAAPCSIVDIVPSSGVD